MPYLADEMFPFELVEPTSDELAAQIVDVIKVISDCDRASLAAWCGAQLFQSSLHSSVVRIEAMVQLAISKATGNSTATDDTLKLLFDALGQTSLGAFADSPEDVQASTVWFQSQNFRVLNGVWRANACYLQRALWIVETMPDDVRFEKCFACIRGLLTLAEVSCERAKLLPNMIGNRESSPLFIKTDIVLPGVVRFSQKDLDSFGIDRNTLRPFIAITGANTRF